MKAPYALSFRAAAALLLGIAWLVPCAGVGAAETADDAQWVWSPAHPKEQVPQGDCYFRRTFQVADPQEGQIQITADDAYELYVNGRQVGTGENWKTLDVYDISPLLVSGSNLIAVKSTNGSGSTGAMVARVVVKAAGGTYVPFSSDTKWKTSLREFPHWNKATYNDSEWIAAQSFGQFGNTLPWGNEVQVAGEFGRFKVPPEFSVEWVIAPEDSGSLIAMTFNEAGHIIASRENGPLLLVRDTDSDGIHDDVSVYCDQLKNCQGMLALNNKLLVVGDGPDGAALYRVSDAEGDGKAEQVESLLRFQGPMGEHGAHAVRLGPDGLIYIVVGNHTSTVTPPSVSSPFANPYEGDLVQPRYEDPGGHAAGIKAPGGTIVRTDIDGSFVELFAGGLRNPYDVAFDAQGEMFTFDADMEWDQGTTWYRPTRINHLVPGGEYGWRSGWAKWPEYYLDSLPATLNMGTGSPTGVAFYDHVMYPVRYQQGLLVGDWAEGRIHLVRFTPTGATYTATASTFVEGRPLNVTDLAVGPDGWLYFCTGGRDTAGGIYRVVWNGQVPPQILDRGEGIQQALRQTQLHSAWGRRKIAEVKSRMGETWDPQLEQVARDTQAKAEQRVRALEIMQLFGPFPSPELLVALSQDRSPMVRGKVAFLMGLHASDASFERLVSLLEDPDAAVRRKACEAISRSGYEAPVSRLVAMLADPDHYVAFAARRSLERLPAQRWQDEILASKQHRVFLYGSAGLLIAHPDAERAKTILNRCMKIMQGQTHDPGYPPGFISDHDFLHMLRVMQLALHRTPLNSEQVPGLSQQIAREYPSQNPIINRELIRLLAYLDEPLVVGRMIQQLQSSIDDAEKVHVAMFAPHFTGGWTTDQKVQLLRFYESARTLPGGHSLAGYIDRASRDFFDDLTPAQRRLVLRDGAKYPSSTLALLAGLPRDPGAETLSQIQQIDRELLVVEGEAADKLRVGVVAVLARSGDPGAMAYLRKVYDRDPERRSVVAMGLAQEPGGENWPYLIRSLPILEGPAGAEVLRKLAEVDRIPDDPDAVRQLILAGLRLKEQGASQAVALLTKWTGQSVSTPNDSWETALASWQAWFAQEYSAQPAATLPADSQQSRWTYSELLSFIESPGGLQGDPQRGLATFQKAQCIKCHRYGTHGESIGPDLTTVSQRFQKKEILQSILFPSHVISDQYASKTVATTDGRVVTGIVAPGADGNIVVLTPSGEKLELSREQIEQIGESRESAMPDNLLNDLSLEEIADLFALFGQLPASSVTTRRGSPTVR